MMSDQIKPKCPDCGSDRVSLPSRSSDLGWIVIRQCFECKRIWEDKEATPVEDLIKYRGGSMIP